MRGEGGGRSMGRGVRGVSDRSGGGREGGSAWETNVVRRRV